MPHHSSHTTPQQIWEQIQDHYRQLHLIVYIPIRMTWQHSVPWHNCLAVAGRVYSDMYSVGMQDKLPLPGSRIFQLFAELFSFLFRKVFHACDYLHGFFNSIAQKITCVAEIKNCYYLGLSLQKTSQVNIRNAKTQRRSNFHTAQKTV